jgi:hypothetical protein
VRAVGRAARVLGAPCVLRQEGAVEAPVVVSQLRSGRAIRARPGVVGGRGVAIAAAAAAFACVGLRAPRVRLAGERCRPVVRAARSEEDADRSDEGATDEEGETTSTLLHDGFLQTSALNSAHLELRRSRRRSPSTTLRASPPGAGQNPRRRSGPVGLLGIRCP